MDFKKANTLELTWKRVTAMKLDIKYILCVKEELLKCEKWLNKKGGNNSTMRSKRLFLHVTLVMEEDDECHLLSTINLTMKIFKDLVEMV